MKENKKEKNADVKEYRVPIETTFEIEIPPSVIEALDVVRGDRLMFYQNDDGQVLLQKA